MLFINDMGKKQKPNCLTQRIFNTSSKKGSTLYFALVILSIAIAVILSLGALVAIQVKTIKEIGDSVIAFYAADTGIERALLAIQPVDEGGEGAGVGYSTSEDLENSTHYDIQILAPGEESCSEEVLYYCIKSIGTYLPTETKRGIQANI
jgi:hypothetical protein